MPTQTKFRLLVVRLGAMGDILHALPAVTALRLAHPGWIIDWVVEPHWSALLAADLAAGATHLNAARPLVDHIHSAPTRRWRKAPFSRQTFSEVKALKAQLRHGDYDTVLDLQGAIRSALIGRLTGCQRLVGEAEPRERAARWFYTEEVETGSAHVIDQRMELAAAVAGDELTAVTPKLPIDPSAEGWADGVLPAGSGPAVLINPGAGWGAKRWPPARYAAVARALVADGLRVLINAGPGEEELAAEIVGPAKAFQSAGVSPVVCSLPQLIALTRRVALAIGGDTGPMHLACALGRPVVGIYGPTDPSRNGPYGAPFRVLRSPLSRRDHSRNPEPEAGLLTITPDKVMQAARDLLATETAP